MSEPNPISAETAAVLTGDLVGSTAGGSATVDATMSKIVDTAQLIGPEGNFIFTRFRGDGWQMIVTPPHKALRFAVIILATLRSHQALLPSRIAIGVGPVTNRGTKDLSDASGPAFAYSGHALDNMGRHERLFHSMEDGHVPEQIAALLIDERIRRWTPEQAEAAALYLDPSQPTSAEVARVIGISPQAASYRLTGAGAGPMRDALTQLESFSEKRLTP
jgi:hypothetical protein